MDDDDDGDDDGGDDDDDDDSCWEERCTTTTPNWWWRKPSQEENMSGTRTMGRRTTLLCHLLFLLLVVGCLLSAPATCWCSWGTDLFRQLHMLPHWDRSCRSSFPPHPVTIYGHLANQPQFGTYSPRCLAGQPLECQFLSHWCDWTWRKVAEKVGLEPRSVATGPKRRRGEGGCWLLGCLTSQQHASVSQGRICSDNCTCCHTEIEVADHTFHLPKSQYTDTGPTSPSADPVTPGAWQGSHWSANF